MDAVEEIKKKIDIVEFVAGYITLQKAGRNFRSPCPFHHEKTPSFVISPERQIWHCFGACNDGGDIVKFLMKWDNIGFGEALKILAQQAGVSLTNSTFDDKLYTHKQKLLSITTLAQEFYAFFFQKHALGEKARSYVTNRTVNMKTAEKFGIGYSPNSWNSLSKFILKKGYTYQEMVDAGLVIKSSQNSYYDRFRGRLMFPLVDSRENVIGFSGRLLVQNAKEVKYINSPETELYHKREHLFGINHALKSIKDKNEVIVTEGEFDTILAHQNGYTNTVAIKGSALTPDHLQFLKRITQRITFALDMDPAGSEAVRRGIAEAEHFDFQMEVLRFEGEKDPADILATAPHEFLAAYKHKIPMYEFIITSALKKYGETDIYMRKNAVEEVLPHIAQINNPIIKEHYLKLLASKTQIDLDTVKKSLSDVWKKKLKKIIPKTQLVVATARKREELLEEYLLALLMQTTEQVYFFETVQSTLTDIDYYSKSTAQFISEARKIFTSHRDTFVAELATTLPTHLTELYNKALLLSLQNDKTNWQREIKKTVLEIKRLALRAKLVKVLEEKNENAAQNIMSELKQVEKALQVV